MENVISIQKTHYEPYPINDVITVWELKEELTLQNFLAALKKEAEDLKKVFDNQQDWNYDVAAAKILLNGRSYGPFREMPYFHEIKSFIRNIDWFIHNLKEEVEPFPVEDYLDGIDPKYYEEFDNMIRKLAENDDDWKI